MTSKPSLASRLLSVASRLTLDFARAKPEAASSPSPAPDTSQRPPAQELAQEKAKPSLTGVRQAWSTESMVAGLTPDRLAGIMRAADQGDLTALLTLAEEMEEREPHYGSVLRTRKLAVAGLERQLSWAEGDEDHPQADEIHKACAKLIKAPAFEALIWNGLDAIAKPYVAIETSWNTSAVAWTPAEYLHRDPRWFQFDRETGRELRLKETSEPDGLPLNPWDFTVLTSSLKSGLPARGGLVRLVAFSFVCKLYGVKDWMAYAEIFGIPTRIGKYGAGATPEDVEVLKRAVFNLGSDSAAVVPDIMKIEFPSLGAAGGAEIFRTLVEWIDAQVSKAVLGQTGTTDMKGGGLGGNQSQVHDEVRSDLKKADAKWLGAGLTAGPLTWYVRFNYGPDAPVPNLDLVVEEPEDIKALSEALGILVPLGLDVGQAEVRRKLKVQEPAEGAAILKPRDTAQVAPIGEPAPAVARDQRTASARARVDQIFAEARARRAEGEAQLSEVQLAALDGWEKSFGEDVAAVMALAKRVDNFEDFNAGLLEMAGDLAAPAAARSLANAMFQAAVIGQAQTRKPKKAKA
jgi:phage gp29-like protein